jgi:hypothetical protein
MTLPGSFEPDHLVGEREQRRPASSGTRTD